MGGTGWGGRQSEDLVEQARALQAEAWELFERLDLHTAFPFGPPHVIGSARSGLMTLRDLDVIQDAPQATPADILTGLAILSRRVDLLSADFRDERGPRRPTAARTDERYYTVLQVGLWKVDLTFWLHVVDRPHIAEAERLLTATDEERRTILRLKQDCPDYPGSIGGTDIYTAVLDRGVRTVAELTRQPS